MLHIFKAAAEFWRRCVPFYIGVKRRRIIVINIVVWLKCLFMAIVTLVC